MNKTAIKNFAVWARNKLIADISYRAGLIGITESGIASALPQSTGTTEFYDIGTAEPYSISGDAVRQRRRLVELIERKEKETDYKTAYKYIIEEVAYTWFNRLIAIRFMEVNDYLPSHIRVLSSESGKMEPDLVTTPFDADLNYSVVEESKIIQLKQDNQLDELFRMLFIKQCNMLNAYLPELFEETQDYSELLLNLSVVDQDGVVFHLIHDIPEEDFDISREGQVEIIGWLYQYYNAEPKDETFALLKKNIKITKERIPAATQLFTPDWIVRYMVENSLGRLWIKGHPNSELAANWKYYVSDAKQEENVYFQLNKIDEQYRDIDLEEIRIIDPCMGSGHILVYCFDVLMQMYEAQGYTQRDAAQAIVENNIYGLDIDKRATQLAYFAVMMKARQYDRRIFSRNIKPHLYAIEESNDVNRSHLKYFGNSLDERDRKEAECGISELLSTFSDAKEYGSIIDVANFNWKLLFQYVNSLEEIGQMTFETVGITQTQSKLLKLVELGQVMAQKYHVVITNPPYMSSSGMGEKLLTYVKENYQDEKSDMSTVMMSKCLSMAENIGYVSMINIPVWMFISSYSELRRKIVGNNTFINMLHFGRGVFGSDFGTTAFVINKCNIKNYDAVYRKLHTEVGNVDSIEQKERWFFEGFGYYVSKKEWFERIPSTPIAYWLSENAVNLFINEPPLREVADPRQGLATGNDEKYLRQWQEVDFNGIKFGAKDVEEFWKLSGLYAPFNKGGAFRKWYGNNTLVIRFSQTNYSQLMQSGNHLPSRQFYFKPGITWTALTAGDFSGRYCDNGFVFAGKGPMCFPYEADNTYYLLGFLNSKLTSYFMKVFSSTTDFNQGPMRDLPLIMDCGEKRKEVECIVKENISLSKKDWDSFEASWDFAVHPLVALRISGAHSWGDGKPIMKLSSVYKAWEFLTETRYDRLKENEKRLNEIFIDIYGLQNELNPDVEDKNVTVRKADLQRDIKGLISYSVGCMFGRYSLDEPGICYAGGKWSCEKYSSFLPDYDNCIPITDEEYFDDDIVGRFCNWIKVVYGEENLEENLDYISKALGNKGSTSREIIRNYFLTDFIKDHIKTYQKKPIYWLFDSGKQNGFKALVYMHRWNADTIGNLRVEYLHRLERIYESEVIRMQDMIDNSTNTREVAVSTKRKEKIQKQIKECHEYDEKIGHLALARIEIDLDDGTNRNYEKVQIASDGKKYQVLVKL